MKTVIFTVLLGFVCQAHAGLFAEPFLGYETNTITGTAVGTSTEAKSTATGIAYGLRLGSYFGQNFWVGADYKASQGSDSSDTAKTDYTTTVIGALVGYRFDKVNVWGGYGVSNSLTFKSNPELKFTGSSLKMGLAYLTPQKINAGVEFALPTYTKVSSSSGDVDVSQIYSSFKVTTAMLFVSYQFGGTAK